MKFETDPKCLAISVERYLGLLHKLKGEGLFGRLAIYPAIGVDGIIALFAKKIVGLNWWPYNPNNIIEHISPIFSGNFLFILRLALENTLISISKIDISNLYLLKKEIDPYHDISPKSFILKSLFKYVFLSEWDSDNERFYNIPTEIASAKAKRWLEEMIDWLNTEDVIIAFDRNLFPLLDHQNILEEIDLGIKDLGEEFDSVYTRKDVPIIFLPHFARVFRKIR